MTIAVNIKLDAQNVQDLFNILPDNMQTEVNNAGLDYARIVQNSLFREVLNDPLRPITRDRIIAATRIKAMKQSKFKSVVKMPRSLVFLDSMQPHYVSLKRGRLINRWAKRNFDNTKITGRSRVTKGPRGGVRGALYVTPHRFVNKALTKSRRILTRTLRKGVRKAFRQSRR